MSSKASNHSGRCSHMSANIQPTLPCRRGKMKPTKNTKATRSRSPGAASKTQFKITVLNILRHLIDQISNSDRIRNDF